MPAHVPGACPLLLLPAFPAHTPTAPGSGCLHSTSVSLPSHPPGQPATTLVVSIFGGQEWARGEEHRAHSQPPAHPLSQTHAPRWRSSTVPTAGHTFSPAKSQLSAEVSGQRPIWPPATPTPPSRVCCGLLLDNLPLLLSPELFLLSVVPGEGAPPEISQFHMSSFRAIEPPASRTSPSGPQSQHAGDMSKPISTPHICSSLRAPLSNQPHSRPQSPKPGIVLPLSQCMSSPNLMK